MTILEIMRELHGTYKMPVVEIALKTGASIPTVYRWFRGVEPLPVHRGRVESLLRRVAKKEAKRQGNV